MFKKWKKKISLTIKIYSLGVASVASIFVQPKPNNIAHLINLVQDCQLKKSSFSFFFFSSQNQTSISEFSFLINLFLRSNLWSQKSAINKCDFEFSIRLRNLCGEEELIGGRNIFVCPIGFSRQIFKNQSGNGIFRQWKKI